MSAIKLTSLFIMSAFYLFAGISHFRKPKFFLKITPKWVPFPKQINLIIGLIEISLSVLLLFNSTRHYAALGVIVLLITVFPANVYHFQQAESGHNQIKDIESGEDDAKAQRTTD